MLRNRHGTKQPSKFFDGVNIDSKLLPLAVCRHYTVVNGLLETKKKQKRTKTMEDSGDQARVKRFKASLDILVELGLGY